MAVSVEKVTNENAVEDGGQNQEAEVDSGPTNPVHARVGDEVLLAARDAVHRGLTSQEIVREIVARYGVRMNVGDLRLLLASRNVPD